MPSTHPDVPTRAAFSFRAHWLAEAVRLREARWGPLDDAAECRRARALGSTLTERILLRADLLARREGLDAVVNRWQQIAHLALAGLLVLALFAGGGAALAALGDNRTPVNLAVALLTLLGLHGLSFLFWLLSLALRGRGDAALLGKVWLWLSKRFARGPDQALAPAALAEWLGRHGLLRWVFGSISHLTWVVALLGQIAVLLVLLAAKRYAFTWETTLLPPGLFTTLTQGLGWLPAQLGFALPSPAVIAASINTPAADSLAHAQWSSWLIGCIVVYGLLPRLLALAGCLLALRRRLPLLALDDTQAGYAALRPRLMPASEAIDADAPPGAPDTLARLSTGRAAPPSGAALAVALELADDIPWPPAGLPDNVQAGANITQRTQREALLNQLHRQPPPALLLTVDGRQTPDRGALSFIHEAQALAGQSHIAVLPGGAAREPQWRDALARLPAPAPHTHASLDEALQALSAAVPTQGAAKA